MGTVHIKKLIFRHTDSHRRQVVYLMPTIGFFCMGQFVPTYTVTLLYPTSDYLVYFLYGT
jgi:hypothetical protein